MIERKTTQTLINALKYWSDKNKENIENIIPKVLHNTLQMYQWYYQSVETCGTKVYRDIRNTNVAHIKTTINLLKKEGQYTLAEDVAFTLLSLKHPHNEMKKHIGLNETSDYKTKETFSDDTIENLFDDPKTSVFTKDKVLSQAKKYMKEAFGREGISESKYYHHDLHYTMETLFINWCKEHPLTQAPDHFDQNFDPPYSY